MKLSLPAATTVEFGRFDADPIPTDFGTIEIDALGLVCQSPWGACHMLRPHSATVHRSNGIIVRAPVGDITGRATLALATAGLIVTAIALRLSPGKD